MDKYIKNKLGINKFYLSKEVFNFDLTVPELRLLIILSSAKVTLDDLDSNIKDYISGNKYEKIDTVVEKLAYLGLISHDGYGLELNTNFLIFKELPSFKSIRQLFMLSLDKWYLKGGVIISKSVFYKLFTDIPKKINLYWKRTCEQLNLDYSYEISKGKVIIRNNKPKSKKKSDKPYIPYKEYLQTEHWLTLSTKIKEDIGKCQLCGSTHRLEVHHNNYDNLWNETSKDLIVLCHNCHSKFHDKL